MFNTDLLALSPCVKAHSKAKSLEHFHVELALFIVVMSCGNVVRVKKYFFFFCNICLTKIKHKAQEKVPNMHVLNFPVMAPKVELILDIVCCTI